MRRIQRSRTYVHELERLLEQGVERFGANVAEQKRALIDELIRGHLAVYPQTGRFDSDLGLYVHTVGRTPFALLYDFDEVELRVHYILHVRTDRSKLELSVDW